jgi:hypothetical protein
MFLRSPAQFLNRKRVEFKGRRLLSETTFQALRAAQTPRPMPRFRGEISPAAIH